MPVPGCHLSSPFWGDYIAGDWAVDPDRCTPPLHAQTVVSLTLYLVRLLLSVLKVKVIKAFHRRKGCST